MNLQDKLKHQIRDVKDFPKEGIIFKDITPILMKPSLCDEVISTISERFKNQIDVIAGVESRGFLFGMGIASKLELPFVPVRKVGKLPYDKISHKYELEYGYSEIEMHTDAIAKGQRVLIHDDLLATGGTAAATAELIKKLGGKIAGFSFLIGLDFLNGDKELIKYSSNIDCLVNY